MSGTHVDPAVFASAAAPSRRLMLAHLAECPACRARVAADDPSILFALLAVAPVPAAVLDAVSRETARHAGLDREAFGSLAESAPGKRWVAVAAVAMLTLVCGYATLRERIAEPVAIVEQRRADVDVTPGTGVSQVIDLAVGETQIVMVYNGDLNL
jgi:anti-sigma factor RsiW